MEGKRGSECLLKSVSNIDFNPPMILDLSKTNIYRIYGRTALWKDIDGLVALVMEKHKINMLSNTLFIFWARIRIA